MKTTDIAELFAKFGCEAVLHENFNGFEEWCQSQDFPPFQGFQGEGLWLEVLKDGKTIASGAAYPIVPLDTLKDHIERYGLFPSGNDTLTCEGEAAAVAAAITGPVAVTGGIVINKDIRGTELSQDLLATISPVIRKAACDRWDSNFTVYVVKEGRKVGRRFRPEILVKRIHWLRDGKPHLDISRELGCCTRPFIQTRFEALFAS